MDWTDLYVGTPAPPRTVCPDSIGAAVAALVAGNERFVELRRLATSVPDGQTVCTCAHSFIPEAMSPMGQVDQQKPFCAVLACADARVPAEIVFDTGANRLFVVRVAGNVPGEECIGSLEYAARMFSDSVQCCVVVGHTGCGAVGAAVASYVNPKGYGDIAFSRSLRSVVNHVLVAVRSAALSLDQVWGHDIVHDAGYAKALAELSVYMNAGITAYMLSRELANEGVPVVFGVYDLGSSKVGFPEEPNGYGVKLSPAPSHPDQLVELGLSLAASGPVRAHLSGRRFAPAAAVTTES